MRSALVAVLAASIAAVAGCGGGSDAPERSPRAAPGESVLATVWEGRPKLARLDPVTLRQRGGVVDVGMATPSAWARSPGGGSLVVGSGDGVRFAFVDLRGMRRTASLDFGARGYVAGLAWPTPRRVVAALSGIVVEILVIDPVASRVVRRQELPGTVMRSVRSPGGLVLLLSPPGDIGRARIAVATPTSVRTASLPLEAGTDPPSVLEPGVAVAPGGRRAIVTAGGTVAHEVDLRTLRTAEQELSERVSLLGRLRAWLEPAASAKGPFEGPVRSATWVPGGRVAVSGWSHRKTGPRTSVADAAGVKLVDTGDWTVRTLAEGASEAVVAGDSLLAFGGSYGPDGLRGVGLRGFDLEGRERFHLFGDRHVGAVTAVGRYAYVSEQLEEVTRVDVVDLASGRVVRTVRRGYTEVLSLD